MFTAKNATIVALMQVGVIVAGVLASGLWHKFFESSSLGVPFPAALLYSYGIGGFIIPMAWLTSALVVRSNLQIADGIKSGAFWFGVMLLIAITGFVIYADVSPFFSITWSLSGGQNE